MSDGYTPVFGTVFDGSLYGKWPESAVWLTMLALCDKRGNVDMSFQAIAGRTGWPMDLLVQGIGALMQPDPVSRSPAHEGRRLIPLAGNRSWGWHVVNHAVYREKARLQGKDAARTASGLDAARKRDERTLSPEVPRSPPDSPATPEVPLSDSYADSDKTKSAGTTSVPLVLHASLPHETWSEWLAHRREKRLSMSPRALNKQLKLLAEYPTAIQREIIDTSINAGWEGLFKPKGRAEKPQGKSEWM